MVKYYYDKYTANPSHTYAAEETIVIATRQQNSDVIAHTAIKTLLNANPIQATELSNDYFRAYSVNLTSGVVSANTKVASFGVSTIAQVYNQVDGIEEIGTATFIVVVPSTSVGGAGVYKVELIRSGPYVTNYQITIKSCKSKIFTTTYTRGTLQQSNIVAEDDTYPNDGRHTDGFWYVKKTVVNTAPTTPGAFTQPTGGTLEIGDVKVFSVGSSTDAENNISSYVWERSINGGAYTNSVGSATPSLTLTIPTATSLKMRVKAVDTGGLESGWRESATFTVSKPIYYWSKYIATPTYVYSDTAPWEFLRNDLISFKNSGYATYYSHNPSANNYALGSLWGDTTVSNGSTAYSGGGASITKYVSLENVSGASIPVTCTVYVKISSKNSKSVNYSRGALVENGITAVEGTYPMDGQHTDGYWYVRGLRVNQSIAPPGKITTPIAGKVFKPNEVANVVFEASSAPSIAAYEVDYRFGTGAWTPLPYNNTLSRSLTITTDKTLKTLELRVRAKNTSNVYSDYVYSEIFTIEHNVAPTVSLTNPINNTTFYENDTININGNANDTDADQSVTAYYQINSDPKKVLATNLSQMQIALSKQLTFKSGKLYDGDTAISGVLADGVAHTLKVWAEDSEKASSEIIERTFYVVPNRAPLLMIDSVVPSGVVDADKFKINGTSSDLDANASVTVTRRINAGNAVEIYNGPGGAWKFEISLAQLVVGVNTIVIEVVDNYGAKTSKTIKLNKNEVKTPILHSVARYKIEPPKGTAKGVLLWIQRDEGLELSAELSMTLKGEQESYVPLVATNTAPVTPGIVEDEFYHETAEPKENIILKISMSRSSTTVNNKINLISGVLE